MTFWDEGSVRRLGRAVEKNAAGEDTSAFRHALLNLGSNLGPGASDEIRRREVFFKARSAELRAVLRGIYVEVLLEQKVSEDIFCAELSYLSFCELASNLRDDLVLEMVSTKRSLQRAGFEGSIEALSVIGRACANRYVAQVRRARDSDAGLLDELGFMRANADVAHEVGGILALTNLLAKEAYCQTLKDEGYAGPNADNVPCLAVAARQLFRLAEEWQTLTFLRQRVAFGEVRVERVDRLRSMPRVCIGPSDATDAWLKPAYQRRHAAISLRRRSSEWVAMRFPVDVRQLVVGVVEAFDSRLGGAERIEDVVAELHDGLASTMTNTDVMLLEHAPDQTRDHIIAIWAGYLAGEAVTRLTHGLATRTLTSGRGRSLVRLSRIGLVEAIAASCGFESETVERGLLSLSSDLALSSPVDLSTRPFIRRDDALLLLTNPFAHSAIFSETRRILASENATSRFVGDAYEKYVRSLFLQAGFIVVPRRVVLKRNGRSVTDVDVLAYKDGVAIVMQAKYLTEPDSVVTWWKSRKQVRLGVMQAAKAKLHFERMPFELSEALGVPLLAIDDVCYVVVNASLRRGGDHYSPVAVVDERYLDHLLTVGELRVFDSNGETVSTTKMFLGKFPSGPELRDALLEPVHLGMLHSGGGGLGKVESSTRTFSIVEFIGHDRG